MNGTDSKRFAEILTGMAELYGQSLTQPAIRIYWQAMQDWTLADFEQAASHLAKTAKYFPRPADFNALRKRAGTLTSGEAWAKVLDYCRGAYRDGAGLDSGGPIDQAAHALGGYRSIAMHDTDALHFLERRFAEHYGAVGEADETRRSVPALARGNGLTAIASGMPSGLVEGAQ